MLPKPLKRVRPSEAMGIGGAMWAKMKPEAENGRFSPFFLSLSGGTVSEERFHLLLRQVYSISECLESLCKEALSSSGNGDTKTVLCNASQVFDTLGAAAEEILLAHSVPLSEEDDALLEATKNFIEVLRARPIEVNRVLCICAAFAKNADFLVRQFHRGSLDVVVEPDDHYYSVILELVPMDIAEGFANGLETHIGKVFRAYSPLDMLKVERIYRNTLRWLAAILDTIG